MGINGKIEIEPVRHLLIETMIWCDLTSAGPPSTRFRSPELTPNGDLVPNHRSFSLVETVLRRRAELMKENKFPVLSGAKTDGRLLVFYPGLSLFDGAAELASDGYFNLNNEPPWDTWVYFGDTSPLLEQQDYRFFLLTWVPFSQLPLVQ